MVPNLCTGGNDRRCCVPSASNTGSNAGSNTGGFGGFSFGDLTGLIGKVAPVVGNLAGDSDLGKAANVVGAAANAANGGGADLDTAVKVAGAVAGAVNQNQADEAAREAAERAEAEARAAQMQREAELQRQAEEMAMQMMQGQPSGNAGAPQQPVNNNGNPSSFDDFNRNDNQLDREPNDRAVAEPSATPSSGGLDTGIVVAIVFGAICFLMMCALVAFFVVRGLGGGGQSFHDHSGVTMRNAAFSAAPNGSGAAWNTVVGPPSVQPTLQPGYSQQGTMTPVVQPSYGSGAALYNGPAQGQFVCHQCGKSYAFAADLSTHTAMRHGGMSSDYPSAGGQSASMW